ncbi:hypothetical protein C5167_043545 [Papaver somniferum]|uniref:Uncharacterized protein n=1 Tax=Papaver somniferum TaxID=3469 RepID=A0A4Y7L5Y6_PAPSO|nr:hypothetical protein C5167_043545 [Papaver somniferum]
MDFRFSLKIFLPCLGKVDSQPSYHDRSRIWPVGYRSSWHDKVTGSLFGVMYWMAEARDQSSRSDDVLAPQSVIPDASNSHTETNSGFCQLHRSHGVVGHNVTPSAYLSIEGHLDSSEVSSREDIKVIHCLQGDVGWNAIPELAKVLEPARKLPTNVETRIRKCVYEALDKGPPEWVKKILRHSISKSILQFTLTTSLNPIANDDDILGYPAMVSRVLDFRTIDLRLAVGTYSGSLEVFLEHVLEVWHQIRTAYGDRPYLMLIAEQLSGDFASLYEKEVLDPVKKIKEHADP